MRWRRTKVTSGAWAVVKHFSFFGYNKPWLCECRWWCIRKRWMLFSSPSATYQESARCLVDTLQKRAWVVLIALYVSSHVLSASNEIRITLHPRCLRAAERFKESWIRTTLDLWGVERWWWSPGFHALDANCFKLNHPHIYRATHFTYFIFLYLNL